jgi:hypothetical protein
LTRRNSLCYSEIGKRLVTPYKETQPGKGTTRMQKFVLFRLIMGLLVALLLMGLVSNCAQTSQGGVTESPQRTPSSKATSVSTILPAPTPTGSSPVPSQPRAYPTVFMILMENHNWSDIAGNSAAPYINNTLLPMSSYARSYYNPPGIHPSEPNYLWLEAGMNFGILNDDEPALNHQSTSMHLATLLDHVHISWKSYQEDISGTQCPLATSGLYAVKHNPTVFFDDVTGTNNPQSTFCIAHERPYPELTTDLQRNTVANYNFITPNICNDMHDSCAPFNNSVQQGDTWLAHQIPLILASQAYKNGGVIFITWDEGEGGDGPIGMIVLSPYAKGKGYFNTIHYTHSSTLRTVEELLGVTPLLGDAANATDLADLFQRFPFISTSATSG